MTEPGYTIAITRHAEGFRVAVDPPHPDHPAQLFADRREARGAAGGLRMVSGWALLDECQPGTTPARKRP